MRTAKTLIFAGRARHFVGFYHDVAHLFVPAVDHAALEQTSKKYMIQGL